MPILSHDDENTFIHHNAILYSKAQIEADDVPWVKMNNLYMSVDITGETSWLPIAKSIGSTKKCAIYTGRHGELAGTPIQGKGGKYAGSRVWDKNHVKEDLERAYKLLTENGISVEVRDLYTYNVKQTVNGLKGCIATDLGAGKAVILAWCQSLYAMMQFDSAATPLKGKEHVRISVDSANQPIRSITATHWSWVPKPW